MTRPPIHAALSKARFDDILRVYAAAHDFQDEGAHDALDRMVIATQLWDLFEQKSPELAAEHRAAVDVSLALKGDRG